MRTLIKISMGLVALAAFALSFATLMALAQLAGYGPLSWLYPVTLDLGTVASCAAWMTTQSRQAFHLTWCLLSASILLNGCEHWLVATGQRPAWWLITMISMAPPAILGVVTHLAVGLGRPGAEGVGAQTDAGPTLDVSPGSGDVARLISEGAGRRRIAAQLGISEHSARQLLTASKNGEVTR